MKTESVWNNHYVRPKSALDYPDENLVRMIKPYLDKYNNLEKLLLFDCGCGSGRHLKLASELGIKNIVGGDIALNGLRIAEHFGFPLIQCDSRNLPFRDSSIDIIICWGSLHYGPKSDIPVHIRELNRVLKRNGVIFGTLRSSCDTMLRSGRHIGNNEWITDLDDVKSSHVSFFSEEELTGYLGDFNLKYGLIERTPLNSINTRISHWYFQAEK